MTKRAKARARCTRAALALLGAWALASCTAEGETPVGSDLVDDILGSRPGSVFVDTLDLVGDTVYPFYTLIAKDRTLEVGRDSLYERSIIVRPNFSSAGLDTELTVDEAWFRLQMREASTVSVRFYLLAQPYQEGDSVRSLDSLGVILDPANGNAATRTMTQAVSAYRVPAALAQAWVRGDTANNGVAIVAQGTAESLAQFESRHVSSITGSPVQFVVNFTEPSQTRYPVSHDATFIRPRTTTSNHVVSDGFGRRLYFRTDLTQLSDSAAVHRARLRMHLVPDRLVGDNQSLILFVPDSSDPSSDGFRVGTEVTAAAVDESSDVVEFPMTLTALAILSGAVSNNGFVIRYQSENTALRQVEFYTSSAADSLRPKVFVTWSTPAEFDR